LDRCLVAWNDLKRFAAPRVLHVSGVCSARVLFSGRLRRGVSMQTVPMDRLFETDGAWTKFQRIGSFVCFAVEPEEEDEGFDEEEEDEEELDDDDDEIDADDDDEGEEQDDEDAD